eukprot:TRINITY_DN12036_c0_g1_i12.p1 TRINITY_DN12036_c0_g1~~TRINITY_DN12036_c0_g1_i12.p1  ORF type:complete len:528 (-),score=156.85 TRINITY_DN12036_c0_g1_i12:320-1903(-)
MWVELGLLCLLLFFLFYRMMTKDFRFFDNSAITVAPPSFPFGSSVIRDMCFGKVTFVDIAAELAKSFPQEKVLGYFMFQSPRYLINDQELAKQIMIKDFEYFVDRPTFKSANKIGQLFLTNLEGAEWKKMRALMSGVFTSGKLKTMLPHICKAGDHLAEYIAKVSTEGKEVDMKDTGGLMTLDAIAAVAFNLDSNSFADPENTFRRMALTLVGAPGYQKTNMFVVMIKALLCNGFPWLGIDVLKLQIEDPEAMAFFKDIVLKTYKQRLESGERRNDIIDIIMDEIKRTRTGGAQKQEFEDEFEKGAALDTTEIKERNYTDEESILVANAVLFFFAGFDTSAFGIGVVSHKLCLYPELQEKIYEEIIDVVGIDGKITPEKLGALKYMDMFISEALRMSEMVPSTERVCTKNYQIPGTNVVIPKGKVVTIYTEDFTQLEENFINAKEFDPENFNPENNPNKFAFQTFGQGPRNCIGMRYALMVMKVAFINILRKHRMVRGSTMQDKLKMTTEMTHFIGGLPATFVKRED